MIIKILCINIYDNCLVQLTDSWFQYILKVDLLLIIWNVLKLVFSHQKLPPWYGEGTCNIFRLSL